MNIEARNLKRQLESAGIIIRFLYYLGDTCKFLECVNVSGIFKFFVKIPQEVKIDRTAAGSRAISISKVPPEQMSLDLMNYATDYYRDIVDAAAPRADLMFIYSNYFVHIAPAANHFYTVNKMFPLNSLMLLINFNDITVNPRYAAQLERMHEAFYKLLNKNIERDIKTIADRKFDNVKGLKNDYARKNKYLDLIQEQKKTLTAPGIAEAVKDEITADILEVSDKYYDKIVEVSTYIAGVFYHITQIKNILMRKNYS